MLAQPWLITYIFSANNMKISIQITAFPIDLFVFMLRKIHGKESGETLLKYSPPFLLIYCWFYSVFTQYYYFHVNKTKEQYFFSVYINTYVKMCYGREQS